MRPIFVFLLIIAVSTAFFPKIKKGKKTPTQYVALAPVVRRPYPQSVQVYQQPAPVSKKQKKFAGKKAIFGKILGKIFNKFNKFG